ncbi:class I SAM-dependent methyltransferase [Candidatus Uhrbacteria bacterium]|nr:class I SAM-dependent methyltransferase [Candidatus Uhrbacteria bacterium]
MNIHYLIENDFRKLLKQELEMLTLDHHSTVLNIACEFELIPPFLFSSLDREHVFGLEINREIVAKVPNIKYCDVDHDRFPFEDNNFDLILSFFGIEHFQDINIFKETCRTLKPGGHFLFVIPNRCHPIFFLNSLIGGNFSKWYYRNIIKSDYQPHTAYYKFNSLGTIKRTAKESGLTVERVTFFGPSQILNYFSFSKGVQKLVSLFEHLLTNKLFYRFKPYMIVVMKRDDSSS